MVVRLVVGDGGPLDNTVILSSPGTGGTFPFPFPRSASVLCASYTLILVHQQRQSILGSDGLTKSVCSLAL